MVSLTSQPSHPEWAQQKSEPPNLWRVSDLCQSTPKRGSHAAHALLQQSNLRAWASEPHVLEAAAGESTYQVPCMRCLLTEPLSAVCLLYTQQ